MKNKLKLKYALDEKPPISDTLLYGLQWFAVTLPTVIVVGQVVAGLHFADPAAQVNYVQKLFFVVAVSMLAQLFIGHRLPVVIGPATVLLVGIIAGQNSSIESVYTSILIGGAVLTLLSISGLFAKLAKLFTSRVVAVILILIAFTIAPTIINLLFTVPDSGMEFFHFCFALIFVLLMFVANRLLKGIWKSTLIVWTLIIGSIIYIALVPQYKWLGDYEYAAISNFFAGTSFSFSLDIGLLISFLVCFLALSINDLGSIQSVGKFLDVPDTGKRLTAGIAVTGLSNILAGFLNVIGSVNFSMSTGIIGSNKVASRYTLVPACIGLLLISFSPVVVAFLGGIPALIIGIILLYLMCSQLAAGLTTAFGSKSFSFEDGLVVALPLMLGIVVAFLPGSVVDSFPPILEPILGNGFVVGTLAVLLMEHVIYRKK